MYKPNRDTKTQPEVSGTLQNSWDDETYTAAILIHKNIRGSPYLDINMSFLPHEQTYYYPQQHVILLMIYQQKNPKDTQFSQALNIQLNINMDQQQEDFSDDE